MPSQRTHARRKDSLQYTSADLGLVAAAGQGAVGVRQLLRVRIEDVGAPAFTPILEPGECASPAEGEALLDRHGVRSSLLSEEVSNISCG